MSYILNEKLTSTLVVWMILKRVLRPWKDWKAAENGIISPVDGKRLRRPHSSSDREGWDVLDRLCWTLKRLYTKYVGESGLAYIFSLAYLMKEQAAIPFKLNIESYKPELESMTADNQLLMYEILQEIEKNNILTETNLDKESTIIKYKNHVAKILQTIASRRNSLKKCVDIQCSDGNWNYDGYMHGMANGMLLALGIFDGKDPRFLEAPKKWLVKEGKQVGVLYHYTSLKSALLILEHNELKPYKQVYGNENSSEHFNYVSLTRDNHFHRLARIIQGIQCRFIIDGDKLSHNYKITPYNDFEQDEFYQGRYGHRPYNDKQEEWIKGSIKGIKNYIIKIQIIKDETFNKEKLEHYIDELGKFCSIEIIDNKPYKVKGMMKEDDGGANAGGNEGGAMSALAGTPSCTVNDIAQFTPRIDMSVGKRRMNRRLTYRRKRRKVKLSEGKQVGILYHYTTFDKLIKILTTNELQSIKTSKMVSFTRDKHFHAHSRFGIPVDQCRLVLDGDYIGENYKVTPYNDFPAAPRHGQNDEREERILGPLRNLDKYLLKVQIFSGRLRSIFENEDNIFIYAGTALDFKTPEDYIKFVQQYAEVELI